MQKSYKKKIKEVIVLISALLLTIPCFPQQEQLQKENKEQSLLGKYSLKINKGNEITTLLTPVAQHYKVDDNFYIALIYSYPASFNYITNTINKVNSDTTIVAPSSGRVFKQGASLTKYSNFLRIQNTDNYGCENGYRSWVKFDISSMPDSANVVWVEQHIYCTELHEGFWDYLNYDIRRIDNDPEPATPLELWSDVFDGAVYEAGEWVSNPPDWEWCLLDPPAASNFTAALVTHDWFGLGYMVKCNEDDADYYAVFKGAQDDLPPYLVIGYDFSTDVVDKTELIESFALYQNYPNPFNPTTTIQYQLPKLSYVEVKVYDVLGREIANLIKEEQSSGIHEVKFDAVGLPSGLYIYKLQTTEFIAIKKMMLVK
ncbi:MAG: T9SS type A sorting domain-containing protein [Ignavibacteriaceae bacterium]|nr:T9SS type A sorting domain-containing protein [Ignavibacteriaceae bacterium]